MTETLNVSRGRYSKLRRVRPIHLTLGVPNTHTRAMIYVGVKRSATKGAQTCVKMTPKHVAESKRTNRCVHAVGGASGAALTKARRELVRQQHNKEVRTTGVTGCCRHHVKNWRTLVSAK